MNKLEYYNLIYKGWDMWDISHSIEIKNKYCPVCFSNKLEVYDVKLDVGGFREEAYDFNKGKTLCNKCNEVIPNFNLLGKKEVRRRKLYELEK
jgi:hypothetical protein